MGNASDIPPDPYAFPKDYTSDPVTTPYAGKKRVANAVCVVTGATGGIGSATVVRLAEEGAKGVVVVDLDQAKCDSFVEKLQQSKTCGQTQFLARAADVTKEEDIEGIFKAAMDKWGKVDVAVANAGTGTALRGITEETVENMEKINRVNSIGVFLTIKHAAKVMRPDPKVPGTASIIVISSTTGLFPAPLLYPYSTSKWAARGLGLSSAAELGPRGIRVNNVHPGGTMTPLLRGGFSTETLERIRKSYPLRRLANPVEIANTILFLASDESSFVTGATLEVSGGACM